MRQSWKKRGTMVAAVALVAAFAPTAGNATGCEDSPEVDTLQMAVVAKDLAASPGDTIKLLVTVTRGLEGDGSPQVPAGGVDSIVVLNPTWPYMPGDHENRWNGACEDHGSQRRSARVAGGLRGGRGGACAPGVR
jgi:hypothetical protein